MKTGKIDACIPLLSSSSNINETDLIEIKNMTEKKSQQIIGSTPIKFTMGASGLFIITINLMLIIGLRRTNKKLTMSQKLYIYLSSTDSIVGFYLISILIQYILNSSGLAINCPDIKNLLLGTHISYCIGMGTFLVISYLRNIAIRKPFHFVQNRTVYCTDDKPHIYSSILNKVERFSE